MSGPLEGWKVLDLSQGVTGPYVTKLCSDYGADVIKVERPGFGDVSRRIGPFPGDDPHAEKSGMFLTLNTGKRSVTLDLATRTGRELLLQLAGQADLIVESYRPGHAGAVRAGARSGSRRPARRRPGADLQLRPDRPAARLRGRRPDRVRGLGGLPGHRPARPRAGGAGPVRVVVPGRGDLRAAGAGRDAGRAPGPAAGSAGLLHPGGAGRLDGPRRPEPDELTSTPAA